MSSAVSTISLRAHVQRFTFIAALALALLGSVGGSMPAAAQQLVGNCAVGGNVADGGAVSLGCAMGGNAGVSLAGTMDIGDPALTVAAGFGGPVGAPAQSVAAVIDIADPSLVAAGGIGGQFPCPAATFADSFR
jgi:hypothetical protein